MKCQIRQKFKRKEKKRNNKIQEERQEPLTGRENVREKKVDLWEETRSSTSRNEMPVENRRENTRLLYRRVANRGRHERLLGARSVIVPYSSAFPKSMLLPE